MKNKFTLQWTDGNQKCRRLRKPAGILVLMRQVNRLLRRRPKKKTHANIITICRLDP